MSIRVEEQFRWKPEIKAQGKRKAVDAHLPDVTVKVYPIIRDGLIPKDHEYSFKAPNTTDDICLMNVSGKAQLHNIFEREGNQKDVEQAEREWLEARVGFDLNPYKEKNNALRKYRVKIGANIKEKPLVLNLNNPNDYLDFLVLSYSGICTPVNATHKKSQAGMKYYMETEEHARSTKKSATDYTMKAFMILGEIAGNIDKMRNLYKMTTNKSLAPNLSADKVLGQLQDYAKENPKNVVETYTSGLYEGWNFILDGMNAGAIIQDPKEGFKTTEGNLLAFEGQSKADLQTAIKFLNAGENQVIKAAIQSRIDVKKQ